MRNKIKVKKTKGLTFFTAAHGLYHFDISQETFNNSLYMNLLFFSTGLAWSDHFFIQGNYVSGHLKDQQKFQGDTWIEAGLREKRIIPFFRGEPDFVVLDRKMREQKLKGLHPESKYLAEKFNAALTEYGVWPSFMVAERYYQQLKDYFGSKNPYWFVGKSQYEHSDFDKIWRGIKDWGMDDIEHGLDQTIKKGGRGVQVSEIINATANRIMKRNVEEVNSVDDLFSLLKENKIGNETLFPLRIYYSLIMEIYNRNLALSLDTKPNSPITNAHIFASHLFRKNLSIGTTLPTFIELGEPDLSTPKVFLSLPSLQVLKNTPGKTLRKIWDSKSADDYFEAIKKWRKAPISDERQNVLYETAHKYSETIYKLIGNDVKREDYELQTINKISDIVGAVSSTVSAAFIQLTDMPADIKKNIGISTPFAAFAIKRVAKHILSGRPLPKKKVELNFSPFQGEGIKTSVRDLTDVSPF